MYSDDSDDYELDYEEIGESEANSDIHQLRCIHKCGKWYVRISGIFCILGIVTMMVMTIISGICLGGGEGPACPCHSNSECLIFVIIFGLLSLMIVLVVVISMLCIFLNPVVRYIRIRYFGFKEDDFFMSRLTTNDMVRRVQEE